MPPHWRPTRRCERLCGATRGRATRSFCGGWPRRPAWQRRRAKTWRGWTASARSACRTRNGRVQRMEMLGSRKMKDGRTHLAHKAEHAVDLDTGAVVAVRLEGADQGDTTTLDATLSEAGMAVAELVGREAEGQPDDKPKVSVNRNGIEELVTDKGYHSGAVVKRVKSYKVRSYIPEKQQKGRRNWQGKAEEQQAVYQNRRRVRGEYGKSLLRRRGELVERSFAHCYETGGMRRTHLRGHENILKRQLIHVGAFNLSLILRQLLGAGTPRELKNRFGRFVLTLYVLFTCRMNQKRFCRSRISVSIAKCFVRSRSRLRRPTCRKSATCTPGC